MILWSFTRRRPGISESRRGNAEGRWRAFDYQELVKRDKLSLDIFWLRIRV